MEKACYVVVLAHIYKLFMCKLRRIILTLQAWVDPRPDTHKSWSHLKKNNVKLSIQKKNTDVAI